MMHRKWIVSKTNKEFIHYLSSEAGISLALAQVLVNRGIKTPGAAKEFLDASFSSMSDPMSIAGMSKAVSYIGSAREQGNKVFVHGDYDVDGVTATAILVSALKTLGLEVEYFIPNRFTHGYGFAPHAVDIAHQSGASLIITVDCGITSFEAVEEAAKKGIDVIITDHHEPHKEDGITRIPDALCVINPKLTDSPTSILSGAGVALKLVEALGLPSKDYIDLAALGTLADVVPLIGENRVIVKEGLVVIKDGQRHGIRALRAVARIEDREPKSVMLAYTLLPRINAAGRIADAGEVVELLTSSSMETAMPMAEGLDKKNIERQKIEEGVYKKAVSMLEQDGFGNVIILSFPGWHEGVIGIVASKLADKYKRPAFVFSQKDGILKGSARSIPGLDLHAAISSCSNFLISFGGHKQAAGVRLKADDLPRFKEEMSRAIESGTELIAPSLEIDATLNLDEVSFNLAKEVDSLEPFGHGNEEPVFGSRGLKVFGPRIVGNNHLKMKLTGKGRTVDAIGFDMGRVYAEMDEPFMVDAAFAVNINDWEGGRALQLNLKGLRPSDFAE